MKLIRMAVGVLIGFAMFPSFGDTCVKSSFNVKYGCGEGTRQGGLLDTTTEQYGSEFTPAYYMSLSTCLPPSGYIFAGQAVRVDGKEVAWNIGADVEPFYYYYTSDIEITPHFVTVADVDTLAVNLISNGREFDYINGAKGTWKVKFFYGVVSGVSQCSTVKPENTAGGWLTGWIASDKAAIENSTSGRYCYCKMTEPYIAASPWVFYLERSGESDCASNCARNCAHNVSEAHVFRASVFIGAVEAQ